MYIQNRLANGISKLVITILGAAGLWLEFSSFGQQAWRLLDTWFLLLVVIYYGINTVVGIFRKDLQGRILCPMLNGAVITTGIGLLIARIASATGAISLVGLEGFGCFLVDFLLPIGVFLDWLILVQKGSWYTVDPWYWLGLMICYAGMMILTARSAGDFAYPYSFLDYEEIGIDLMAWWVILVSLVILLIGYGLFLFDFSLSGELRRHIVMPRIKTIVIEEVIDDETVCEELPAAQGHKEAKTEKAANADKSLSAPKNKKPAQKIVVEDLKDKKAAQNLHGTKNRKPSKTKPRPKKTGASSSKPAKKTGVESAKSDKPKSDKLKVDKPKADKPKTK